ncbi:iron-sulfur protein [Pseudonocardia xishanensis]|uniref:(2Fe-2S)-binding protein n=1 Tax=Pseudonocardia xishanensis TaxID=630995 RepID=A0ABP8RST9_9PSEU
MEYPLDVSMRRVGERPGAAGGLYGAPPSDPDRWIRCAEVDAEWYRGWEGRIAASLHGEYGRTDVTAAAALALIWYAGVPGRLGGAAFREARRVPRLGRAEVAFRLGRDEPFIEGYALLDTRFWCLPDDPDAAHPAATVVSDERALAARLRAEVDGHAEGFLRDIRPGARLPRRALRGAFCDGIAVGIWVAGDQSAAAAEAILRDAGLLLSGGVAERGTTSMDVVTDVLGRDHVCMTRACCCYLFRVVDHGRACATCPRVPARERPLVLARDHEHGH